METTQTTQTIELIDFTIIDQMEWLRSEISSRENQLAFYKEFTPAHVQEAERGLAIAKAILETLSFDYFLEYAANKKENAATETEKRNLVRRVADPKRDWQITAVNQAR